MGKGGVTERFSVATFKQSPSLPFGVCPGRAVSSLRPDLRDSRGDLKVFLENEIGFTCPACRRGCQIRVEYILD